MGSPASGFVAAIVNPIAAISTAIAAIPQLIQMNQAKQAAKGAQNAAKDQQDKLNKQIDLQKKTDAANLNAKGMEAGASQKAAIDAIRASMSANSGAGGTILTGPQGATPASIGTKTLLGV